MAVMHFTVARLLWDICLWCANNMSPFYLVF